MRITLPDGSEREYDRPVTPAEVAAEIGPGLARAAIGAKVNGELWDLGRPIETQSTLELLTEPKKKAGLDGQDPDALYLVRHSAAHVMAEAIQRLFPEAKLAYGPPLETGFYYDIALERPIRSDDFERIEAEMRKIIAEDRPFTRYELDPETGLAKLEAEGNPYKIDNARRALEAGAPVLSWYVTGPAPEGGREGTPPEPEHWEDLCMGPHVPSTGRIGAVAVTSVAQSHWHGDITRDAFQRVYGTAFFHERDLEAWRERLAEARERDHRVLGQKLGLFTIDEQVGQGLILWKPNGAVIREALQRFIGEHLARQGYDQVFTPHIGKLDLFRTSGHFPYYQESQYPAMIDSDQVRRLADEGCTCAELANRMREGEIEGHLLKPMNCPFHIRIYASEKRSYRDLPIRLAEFGTVYRWEQSGEIGGLTRVRGFTQDDAHLFVTEAQLGAELHGCLDLVRLVFGTLGMADYRVRVGLRDPASGKYVGEEAKWAKAEAACREAAESLGVAYEIEPGEAAFYGPKIDFVVRDCIGRPWQLGTVQVDYQLPERFDLRYVGRDNAEHRPVMIHRAPFGSMERFIGVLIEHFNGAFPLWLSPEQVRVLPVSDRFLDYARTVRSALAAEGLRAKVDDANERVGAKIAIAQEAKIPYMLVVGGRDEAAGTVSVRHRTAGEIGQMPLERFVAEAAEEHRQRRLEPTVGVSAQPSK